MSNEGRPTTAPHGRITDMFRRLRAQRRTALIAYLTVGYPKLDSTGELVTALVEGGCDLIELGIPFSDPLADGATIQRASFGALQNGVTPKICLSNVADLRGSATRAASAGRRADGAGAAGHPALDIPVVFMSYFNPIISYGVERFCAECAQVGADGLIIPDVPPGEGGELDAAASKNGLDVVYMLAPTSTDDRIRLVAAKSRGFIYLVSLTGVTGAREALPVEVEDFVGRVRGVAQQPLCVGFGISTPEQAARMAKVADGIIVGSKLIEVVEQSEDPASALQAFVRSLRDAVDA